MGRTVPTYRLALDEVLARWEREFGRALTDPADRAAFHQVILGARRYIPQGTQMSSGDLLERLLLSVIVDLNRRTPPRTEGALDPTPSSGPPGAPPRVRPLDDPTTER
ncbi:MAG: hypothetical protein ACYDFT_06660 [Thermoplasmata archaeon]